MGTRSITLFYDNWFSDDNEICKGAFYRQHDGYPEGHGTELAEALNGVRVVNGISSRAREPFVNGIGDLAAQTLALFKTKGNSVDGPLEGLGEFFTHKAAGSIYMVSPDSDGVSYTYEVRCVPGDDSNRRPIHLTVRSSYDGSIYEGLLDEFDASLIDH